MIRIFVIGCGSIGERHIRNVAQLGYTDIIGVDTDEERLKYIKDKYRIKTSNFSELKKLLEENMEKISIISVPNHLHVKTATLCAGHNSHVFIEKPFSHTKEGISALEKLIKEKNLILMVACNLRFYPAIKYIKECLDNKRLGRTFFAKCEFGSYLPNWRPTKDYRKNYGAKKEEGGGVILDLYHEFDYLYWFFGVPSKITSVYKKAGSLEINTEDTAEVIMEFKDPPNFICGLHLDYLQYKYVRFFKVVGEKGIILWNWDNNAVTILDDKGKIADEFKYEGYDVNNMYLDEMKHFFECISQKKRPVGNIDEAKNIQSIIFKTKESGLKERAVKI